MKKILILCLIAVLLATAIKLPSIDITGLFLKTTSVVITIAKEVVKQILTAIVNVL